MELRFPRLVFLRFFSGTGLGIVPNSVLGVALCGTLAALFLAAGSMATEQGLLLDVLLGFELASLKFAGGLELLSKLGSSILVEHFLSSSEWCPLVVGAPCTFALKNGPGYFQSLSV